MEKNTSQWESTNNIVHIVRTKNGILLFREGVKFSLRIYIIDSVKFTKDFKLAKASNSKIFLTQILLHQLLNSTA